MHILYATYTYKIMCGEMSDVCARRMMMCKSVICDVRVFVNESKVVFK